MNRIKGILMVCTIIIVLLGIIISNNLITENRTTKIANASAISNSMIAWGVKREKDHIQPDLGSKNLEILKKYNGIAMGNKEKKNVYLTFDEGYEAGYTKQILQTLKENDVKAVFFITAHYLNTEEELVKQMIEDGHTIGNHIRAITMYGKIKSIKAR